METRANYILIGAFTLAALIGTLAFFIFLASVKIDRRYNYYGILFDDVSGLDSAGDVLFNGISVGSVTNLRIYEKDPSKVFTEIRVDATTPVFRDTVAQLQSQGVTGVAYISLSGGTPDSPRLRTDDGTLPIIPSERSTVQALIEDAPDVLQQAKDLLAQLQTLTGPENRALVTAILGNVAESSGRLNQAIDDFSSITGTVRDATDQITQFTGRLDAIGATLTTTLEQADATFAAAKTAFDTANTTIAGSATAIESAQGAFAQAQVIMTDQVPGILARVTDTVDQTNAAIADLSVRTGATIDSFGQTANLMNARLTELETTLSDATLAFAAVTEASDGFTTLVYGDGAALVAESRAVLADAKTALGTVETVMRDDVPAIVADIRAAVTTATNAVDKIAINVTNATGGLEPLRAEAQATLTSANALFTQAQTTLTALETTLSGADDTLTAAETAFGTATGVMNTDLGPVLADIRTASDRISTAVEDVTADVPAITQSLQDLIARADAVVAQVQAAVAAASPGIADFAGSGLPELNRLAVEARGLVTTLNGLVRRIDSNPARFLLDDRVPEYRR